MSNLAIRIDGLGKRYRIGLRDERPETLFGAAASVLKSPLKSYRDLRNLNRFDSDEGEDVIWALRDVFFDVKHGEVVGLIGRNGSGKSTLLKVLSRITEPTRGRIDLYGRVASLLEVGTGFHADLTGRENVYLNGAILGMTKAEIDRKFDEIVAFSEIEKFIDTPVKRYSSGMKVRLAFAVAAHLEPEILLIDEVLAVGDVAFQKKCLGKMDDVAGEGRTVIFVSHHMNMIQALCQRGIVLDGGQVMFDGAVDAAISEYIDRMSGTLSDPFGDNPMRRTEGEVRMVNAYLVDDRENVTEGFVAGRPMEIRIEYTNPRLYDNLDFVINVYNNLDAKLLTFNWGLNGYRIDEACASGVISCVIPKLPLAPGAYRIAMALKHNGVVVDHVPNALRFSIESSIFYGSGRIPPSAPFMTEHSWRHNVESQREPYA